VTWTNGGTLVASGASDGSVRIWTVAKHKMYRTFSSKNQWVNGVAFCEANDTLAIGLGDGKILLRDLLKDDDGRSFKAHHDYVNAVAWMPGTNWLCSGSGGGSVRIWDIASGKNITQLDYHTDKILRLSFSFDGRLLATLGQDRLAICDTQTWKPIHTVKGPFPTSTFLPLAFTPTAKVLATALADDPTAVLLVNLESRPERKRGKFYGVGELP
jgi:WD40 repeat protein